MKQLIITVEAREFLELPCPPELFLYELLWKQLRSMTCSYVDNHCILCERGQCMFQKIVIHGFPTFINQTLSLFKRTLEVGEVFTMELLLLSQSAMWEQLFYFAFQLLSERSKKLEVIHIETSEPLIHNTCLQMQFITPCSDLCIKWEQEKARQLLQLEIGDDIQWQRKKLLSIPYRPPSFNKQQLYGHFGTIEGKDAVTLATIGLGKTYYLGMGQVKCVSILH